jgi:hypothetical protein
MKREFYGSVPDLARNMSASDQMSSELLAEHTSDTAKFMEHFFALAGARGFRAAGFKLFYYHAREPSRMSVWEEIYRSEDIAFIHLYRANLLDSFLSRALAVKSGSWTSGGNADFDYHERVVINIRAFQTFCDDVRSYRSELDRRLPVSRTRTIEYGALTTSYGDTMKDLQDQLGIDQIDIVPPMSKQRKRDRWSYVENADEVRDFLAKSGMANCI